MSMTEEEPRTEGDFTLVSLLRDDDGGTEIPVHISLEIIRLFSEGLYQSPHKAIEEPVTKRLRRRRPERPCFATTPGRLEHRRLAMGDR